MLCSLCPRPPFSTGKDKQAADGAASEECQRAAFVRDNPALLQKFSADLLPLMIKVGRCSRRRYRCLV